MTRIGMKRDKTTPRKYLKRTPMKRSPCKDIDLDILCSKVVRLQSRGICQRCGKQVGFDRLEWAHDTGRRNHQIRHEIANSMAFCHDCHQYMDDHAQEKHAFFREKIGDEQYDALQAKALRHDKIDREAIKLFLQNLLNTIDIAIC